MTIKQCLLFFCVIFTSNGILAQQVVKHPLKFVKKVDEVNLATVPDNWPAGLVKVGQASDMQGEYIPRKSGKSEEWPVSKKTGSSTSPVLLNSFEANPSDGIPVSDNDMAIGNNGRIVSVMNKNISVFNIAGAKLLQKSFDAFAQSLGLSATKFDPRVIYDPLNDRFIVAFLNGTSPTTSKIIVAFSKTNLPEGEWNLYAIDGNVLGNTWTDFPQIGISTEELFITGNNFQSSIKRGSNVWQIRLSDGYNGLPLKTQVYTVPYNTNTLNPVTGGSAPYGPHFYIISNFGTPRTAPIDSIFIYKVTSSLDKGGSLSERIVLQADTKYELSPEALQKGTNLHLQTNNCRIQGSYLENGKIQFIKNASLGHKHSSLYYGTIELNETLPGQSVVKGTYITSDTMDIAYGTIAYAGCQENGKNISVVMTNYSSSNHYPGNCAYTVLEGGTYSDPILTKSGEGVMGGNWSIRRWGDYTGIAPRYSNPGEVWGVGSYGLTSSDGIPTGAWISQLQVNSCGSTVNVDPVRIEKHLKAYPNPATEMFRVSLEIPNYGAYTVRLFDSQGKLINILLDEYVKAGAYLLYVDRKNLSAGTYFIQVSGQGSKVLEAIPVVLK